MEIFKEIGPLRSFLKEFKLQNKSIGLVPTMGALHDGHLAVIKTSKSINNITVCSIYVNPTQFNNSNDLLKYPRTVDSDIEKLKKVECDILFFPENEEMYQYPSQIQFDFGALDKIMEGQFRPGHFSGVALVVSKLFNIIKPDDAYFGQKDWQQFAIIRQLVDELKFDLTLHSIPTYREPDGLAMSSRNQRLNLKQRGHALVFYKALLLAKQALKEGESVKVVKERVKALVDSVSDAHLEYFEVATRENLNLIENVKAEDQLILCIAGYIGDVRLIDNMFLD